MNIKASTFEHLMVFKKYPYYIYWPFVGLLSFIIGNIPLYFYKEKTFIITQALFAFGISFIPCAYIWMAKNFRLVIDKVSNLYWKDSKEYLGWSIEQKNRIFTLKSKNSKIVVFLIFTLGMYTIFKMGLPFNNKVTKILAISYFLLILLVYRQGAYILIDLLITLKRISKKEIIKESSITDQISVLKLQNYYLKINLLTTIGYFSLYFAIFYSPYGINPIMQIWLLILAIYPIGMFFWTFYQIHNIMMNIKNKNAEQIEKIISMQYELVIKKSNKENLENYKTILEIYKEIQSSKEWPIDLAGIITFLLTITATTIQVIISIITMNKAN